MKCRSKYGIFYIQFRNNILKTKLLYRKDHCGYRSCSLGILCKQAINIEQNDSK